MVFYTIYRRLVTYTKSGCIRKISATDAVPLFGGIITLKSKSQSRIYGRRHTMQITDVKVRKLFEEGPMKAIVSVTFDGQLAVHDIKVINARDKFFIVMPSRKNPDDTYRDIVHPINAQFRAILESAVIEAYQNELKVAASASTAAAAENSVIPDTPSAV